MVHVQASVHHVCLIKSALSVRMSTASAGSSAITQGEPYLLLSALVCATEAKWRRRWR